MYIYIYIYITYTCIYTHTIYIYIYIYTLCIYIYIYIYIIVVHLLVCLFVFIVYDIIMARGAQPISTADSCSLRTVGCDVPIAGRSATLWSNDGSDVDPKAEENDCNAITAAGVAGGMVVAAYKWKTVGTA